MCIRIPIPRGVSPGDTKRLRGFATWYLRQVAMFGPSYGAKRRQGASPEYGVGRKSDKIRAASTTTTSRIGSAL